MSDHLILIVILFIIILCVIILFTLSFGNKDSSHNPHKIKNLHQIYEDRCLPKSIIPHNTYIISLGSRKTSKLPSGKKRLQNTQTLLSELGIKTQHFPAVDPNYIRKNSKKIDSLGLYENPNGPGTPEKYACALSHCSLWASLLASDFEYFMIFEDDITSYISKDKLQEKMKSSLSVSPQNWDFIFLGKCLDKCDLYKKVGEGIYISKNPHCLHAYLISRNGAKDVK